MLNALKTTILLAIMTALFMGVGYVVGGQAGMILAFGFAVVTNFVTYWNADKIVLRMQNAEPVDRARAPELHDALTRLAHNAGIPVPDLYLIHTDQPNAFATGRDPNHAAVAVSTGLVHRLSMREVAAVMSHELGHIRSRDTLTMTITATLAGAISMLAQFGFFFGGRNNNSPFGFLGVLAMMIVAPLAAMMVQMAVSRTREYEADRDGAEISGDPLALASALEKIHQAAQRVPNLAARRSPGLAHMYIVNPLAGGRMDNLFATHPDTGNRIAQLQRIAADMQGRPAEAQHDEPPAATGPVDVDGHGPSWRVPSARRGSGSEHRSGPWG